MRLFILLMGLAGCLALLIFRNEILGAGIPFLDRYLLLVNGVAFAVYSMDKLVALNGMMLRVPEKILLMLAILGGSGGAALSQGMFNHKVSKASFQARFLIGSVASIGGLVYLCK